MKHVLITGASGFIGSYCVEEFIQQGWHVFALRHRKTYKTLEELEKLGKITIVDGDITDPVSLQDAFRVMGKKSQSGHLAAIAHCAGRASDIGWREEFQRTNYESVKYLVQLTKEYGVDRFVFVSSADVYGLKDFKGEKEEQLPLENNRNNPYPEFKIASENWIRTQLPLQQYSILRPVAVWGVGDKTYIPRITKFLRYSPWIVHFGKWRGTNSWPLAHVRNVAAAIYLAATMPEASGRAIHVIDSETTTADEFYRILASVYFPRKRFKSITLPMWIGQLYGAFASGFSNLFNLEQPFLDPSLYALYAVSSNLNFNSAAVKELFAKAGRVMISKEQGIQELMK